MVAVGIGKQDEVNRLQKHADHGNSHMERGGKPVKSSRKNAKTPLMITCQPMAIYFSWDF